MTYCGMWGTSLQAAQFAQARREELLDLQRTLLGMEDIAVKEGLKPSEAEIEVRLGREER